MAININHIKYDVRLEIDLYANGEEDLRNILRDIQKAVFEYRGVDGISVFKRETKPEWEEILI